MGQADRLAVPTEDVVNATARRMAGGAVVLGCALVVAYWLFVWTPIGQQVDALAYEGRHALGHRYEQLDPHLLSFITVGTLAATAVVLVLVGLFRGLPWRGLAVVCALGGATVGAEVMKAAIPRPILYSSEGVADGLVADSTFPSGHTTISASLVLAAVLMCPARMRARMAVAAGAIGAMYATAVLFAGWHRGSDALGGLALAGMAMSCAALVSVWLERGRQWAPDAPGMSRASALTAVGIAVLMVAAALAAAWAAMGEYPDADLPFVIMVVSIVASAFALAVWFGWAVRQLR